GFEVPLANADLSDPTQYHDPQSPDALPAISVDGSEDQSTYIRPFRGGSDANAQDTVTLDGAPLTLVVYVNGPPLTVTASARTLSSTATGSTASFDATVQTANGSPLPASALSWSWSFGDGQSTTAATPTHQFPAGSYDITVQVTDASSGEGGTDTIQFTTPAAAAPGRQTHRGGSNSNKSKSPTGTANGNHGTRPAGTPGAKNPEGSANGPSNAPPSNQPTNPANPSPPSTPTTAASPATSTAPAETTTTTTNTTTSSPSPIGSGSRGRAASHPKPPRKPARRTPPAAPAGTLVSGRLISDVTPLPVTSSPLVHLAPAAAAAPPAVQQATRTTSLSTLGAALAVAALLGLGAWRELRGRRRSRAALPGH
ncbi:MAG: PKD domain-containing protein, partial [Solirubrobacterales bacterium]|nr:PKD domain-containing protein [Solirubrobacterales bacterium]